MLSSVRLFATPWTIAHQAPLSMGFSRQEHWSGWPFPSPGDLPDARTKPGAPALQADSFPSELPGKPTVVSLNDTELVYNWASDLTLLSFLSTFLLGQKYSNVLSYSNSGYHLPFSVELTPKSSHLSTKITLIRSAMTSYPDQWSFSGFLLRQVSS